MEKKQKIEKQVIDTKQVERQTIEQKQVISKENLFKKKYNEILNQKHG